MLCQLGKRQEIGEIQMTKYVIIRWRCHDVEYFNGTCWTSDESRAVEFGSRSDAHDAAPRGQYEVTEREY